MNQKQWRRLLFFFTGLFSLLWFLVRVIPKPSRAAYPCQRAAFPIASSFILWIAGAAGLGTIVAAVKVFFNKNRLTAAILLSAGIVVIGCGSVGGQSSGDAADQTAKTSVEAVAEDVAIGTPRGANPGRVVWAHDPDLTDWDKRNTDGIQYWSDKSVNQELLDTLFAQSLQNLAGTDNDLAAWNTLFTYTNSLKGKQNAAYQKGETIAVKVNLNNQNNPYASEDKAIDASPHMILTLLKQLVEVLGAEPSDIIVYDALRPISAPVLEMCQSIYPDVRFWGGKGYPNSLETEFPWTSDAIHYSNGKISGEAAMSIPSFVLEADYIINMAILKTHGSVTGVTLCGKNHYGSIGGPDFLHGYTHPSSDNAYSPQVDIFGHADIWNKTVLYMIDGLFGAKGSSGCVARPRTWNTFADDWPSSLFLSQDIVAIDSVGIDFLAAEDRLRSRSDNYLHEAALAHNPPSGTLYDPEGDGEPMVSLGVHEHWNNSDERDYTTIDFVQLK